MAKLIGPLLSAEATGRISGLVFYRTKAGPVVGRYWSRGGSGPITSLKAKATFADAANAWTRLDAPTRQHWVQRHGSMWDARQAYVAAHMHLVPSGFSVPTDPLPVQAMPFAATFDAYWHYTGVYRMQASWHTPDALDGLATLAISTSPLRRSSCSDRQYKQVAWGYVSDNGVTFQTPLPIKTLFMRLRLIDIASGGISAEHFARFEF